MTPAEAAELLGRLGGGWAVDAKGHLSKELTFPDFRTALAFTNSVGELAESEGHHPDLHLAWGKVGIEIWTHKVDGLTESDFILAARIDRLERVPSPAE
jgi:4a-hydroxytetrahydrobiopterin dehydratase